uniref:Uncharacterized protein n=1 Tax=viral metagenome TaxID=1070528 RepID=A0A6M3L1D1_9ZZZZ
MAEGKEDVTTRDLMVRDDWLQYVSEDGDEVVLKVPSVREALSAVIAIGANNIRMNPRAVSVSHVLKCLDILTRIDKSAQDKDELVDALKEVLLRGTMDSGSPLGAALEARERARDKEIEFAEIIEPGNGRGG